MKTILSEWWASAQQHPVALAAVVLIVLFCALSIFGPAEDEEPRI